MEWKLCASRCQTEEYHVAEAQALFLDSIQKASRPDKLSRQDAQREENGQPSRTRCNYHDYAKRKQGETKENLEEPLSLLERSNQHQINPTKPSSAFLLISLDARRGG